MAMPHTMHRFTVDEFLRMAETGVLADDARVELIDGQVVEMSPIGPDHMGCVNRLTRLFAPLMHDRVTVSIQNALRLTVHQALQPDVAVLAFRADGYTAAMPTVADTLLVVEVGDATAGADRRVKVPRYAEAGVLETWLVDLPNARLEVYREPQGNRYQSVTTREHGSVVAPSALPDLELSVTEILGR